MNVIVSSDFPASPAPEVVERLRAAGSHPRIAWISADAEAGAAFAHAREQFAALGFTSLECVDVEAGRDEVQLAYLHEFDVIYLGGADALRCRFNALRAGLAGRLRYSAAQGRLIIGASGGALLLTPNVSLARLEHEPLDEVLAARARYDAMGAVPYEVLPHAERRDAGLLAKVRDYSARAAVDVIALADGAALLHTAPDRFRSVGALTHFRAGGIISQLP